MFAKLQRATEHGVMQGSLIGVIRRFDRSVIEELLFDVIAPAYERTSLILTTNLPFENWTEVLGSERLSGAALDRLTHRCHILETKGRKLPPPGCQTPPQTWLIQARSPVSFSSSTTPPTNPNLSVPGQIPIPPPRRHFQPGSTPASLLANASLLNQHWHHRPRHLLLLCRRHDVRLAR